MLELRESRTFLEFETETILTEFQTKRTNFDHFYFDEFFFEKNLFAEFLSFWILTFPTIFYNLQVNAIFVVTVKSEV